MCNILIIGIYIPFAIITAVIFVRALWQYYKRKEDYLFVLLCCCAFCWFASNIALLLTENVETAKFLMNFIPIFVELIPPLLLLFVLKFYKVSYMPSIIAPLFAIPAINIVMALTSMYHLLMHTQLDIISLSPVREVVRVWGPWFWAHTGYCYIVSIALIGIIIFRHFNMPRFYRIPSALMVAGVFLTLSGNVVTLLQLLPPAMDITLITLSLSLMLFKLAIINDNKSKFVRFSHRQIYRYLEEYILVLDENHRVVDCNRSALDWFSSQRIPLNASTLEDVVAALLRKGEKKNSEIEGGTDIYLGSRTFPTVLNLCVHDMTDAKGDIIGAIGVFTDVTQNRMLIEKLEEKVGMDSLTGLSNHMAYEGAKKRLDAFEYLPLSVIMCDVNGIYQ